MRRIGLQLAILLFVVTCQLVGQQKWTKFGDAKIRIDTTIKMTTAIAYRDSAGTLVLADLKVMLPARDVMLFENDNLLSNTTAIVIKGVSQTEFDLILALKRTLEAYHEKGIDLTPEQAENIILNTTTWLSNKKVGK